MSDLLTIEPHIQLTTIEIWEPRYHDWKCLILKSKPGVYKKIEKNKHYKIWFSRAKSLEGKEFYIRGENILKHKLGTNGTKPCYEVPMEELTEMKIDRRFL